MMHLMVPEILVPAGVVATGLGALIHGTFVPSSQLWGPVISHGDRGGAPRVALTFDDGPTPGSTDRVLDILRDMNVKAAFFVIGKNAAAAPDLLRRIDAEGHLVGNHSLDHSHWGSLGQAPYWQNQVDETDQIIEGIVGRRPGLFRPPVGIKTLYTMRAARRRGHAVVTWSVRGLDGMPTTSDRILNRVLPRCRAGAIISLHDGVEPNLRRDPQATLAALRPLITGLRERNLAPVRLDELIGRPAYANPAAALTGVDLRKEKQPA